MSQDTEARVSDEDVATWAAIQFDRDVRRLAREVQASRKLVADLRAIPMQDDDDPYDDAPHAYNAALRDVLNMIDEAGL